MLVQRVLASLIKISLIPKRIYCVISVSSINFVTNKQKFIVLKSREIMCLCSSSPILQSNFSFKKDFKLKHKKK